MRTLGRGAPSNASVTGCPEFDYAPGQPNLYLMMRFKQDVVARHGLKAGLRTFVETFDLPTSTRVRETRIEGERAFAERHGAVFVETATAGEPFVNMPPRVIGEGNHRPLKGHTRSDFVACLQHARVRGRSALIEIDGRLLLDVQDDERQRLDDELEWDPVVFHVADRRIWRLEHSDRLDSIDVDEAFTLLGAHTDFFGHWMCEYLPRFVSARLSGHLPDMPVLIDAHMPPAHRASLESLYGKGLKVIEIPAFTPVSVRRLWCAPSPSYLPLHEIRNEKFTWDAISVSGQRLAPIIREMRRRFDERHPRVDVHHRGLFLARRAFRHRCLVNSASIEQEARKRGVLVCYPEDLAFDEQVSLVRSANVLVVPEGSAVFLAMFARPGARLCILSHPITDLLSDYNAMLRPHGIHTVVLTGPIVRQRPSAPNDADYSIDDHLFMKTLEELLNRRPTGSKEERGT